MGKPMPSLGRRAMATTCVFGGGIREAVWATTAFPTRLSVCADDIPAEFFRKAVNCLLHARGGLALPLRGEWRLQIICDDIKT